MSYQTSEIYDIGEAYRLPRERPKPGGSTRPQVQRQDRSQHPLSLTLIAATALPADNAGLLPASLAELMPGGPSLPSSLTARGTHGGRHSSCTQPEKQNLTSPPTFGRTKAKTK